MSMGKLGQMNSRFDGLLDNYLALTNDISLAGDLAREPFYRASYLVNFANGEKAFRRASIVSTPLT